LPYIKCQCNGDERHQILSLKLLFHTRKSIHRVKVLITSFDAIGETFSGRELNNLSDKHHQKRAPELQFPET